MSIHDGTAIEQWKRTLGRYNDENYFFIVKNYLGNIATPFHKPALTDRLTAFFLNEEHQNRIIALLDDTDRKFLCAVSLLGTPTEDELVGIFLDRMLYSEIARRIVNLEERLLLLPGEKNCLMINPLLAPRLEDGQMGLNYLFDIQEPVQVITPLPVLVTSEMVRAYINLVIHQQIPESTALENRLYASTQLSSIFPSLDKDRIPKLFAQFKLALIQLQVLQKHLQVDIEKANTLLCMHSDELVTVLCAGAWLGKLYGENISQLGNTIRMLKDLLYVMSVATALEASDLSTLLKILLQRHSLPSSSEMIQELSEILLDFGILNLIGSSYRICGQLAVTQDENVSLYPLTIDSDGIASYFGVRSANREDLLYLFAQVRQVDTMTSYEISRQSFRQALDLGLNFEQIVSYLDNASQHDVQQHLLQAMGEWYAAYHSVRIYDGIIVCCDTRMSRIVDQHPQLQQFIVQRIQDGIYLFTRENEHRWRFLLKNAGADMLPRTVKEEGGKMLSVAEQSNARKPDTDTDIDILSILGQEYETYSQSLSVSLATEQGQCTQFLEQIKNEIEALKLTGLDKEEMESRYHNKLLVDVSQVVRQRLYAGTFSASGFDFRGKVNICKTAIASRNMVLEIHTYEDDQEVTMIAQAKELINPSSQDAMVRVLVFPTMEERTLSISRLFFVRLQRLSLII